MPPSSCMTFEPTRSWLSILTTTSFAGSPRWPSASPADYSWLAMTTLTSTFGTHWGLNAPVNLLNQNTRVCWFYFPFLFCLDFLFCFYLFVVFNLQQKLAKVFTFYFIDFLSSWIEKNIHLAKICNLSFFKENKWNQIFFSSQPFLYDFKLSWTLV